MFNCIDLLLHFVVMSELVAFINFDFATQHVALDHVDVRYRKDLVESRRQQSTLSLKCLHLNAQIFFIIKKNQNLGDSETH